MNSRVKLLVLTSSTVLVILLLIGSVLGKSSTPDGPYRHLAVYTEVLSRIKSEYVEEPDMKSVTLGALNGLLESVDPFASYLNADQYKEYLKNKDAKKADVGLLLSKKFGYLGVVDVGSRLARRQSGARHRRHDGIHQRHRDARHAAGVRGAAAAGGPRFHGGALRGSRAAQHGTADYRADPREHHVSPRLPPKMLQAGVGYIRPALGAPKVKEIACRPCARLAEGGAKTPGARPAQFRRGHAGRRNRRREPVSRQRADYLSAGTKGGSPQISRRMPPRRSAAYRWW